jgi:hypothetical protein
MSKEKFTAGEEIQKIKEAAAVAASLNLARPRSRPPKKIRDVVHAATAAAAIQAGYSKQEIAAAGIETDKVETVTQILAPTAKKYFDFVVQTLQPFLLGRVSLADRVDSDYFCNPDNVEKINSILRAFDIPQEFLSKSKTYRAAAARDLCAIFARMDGAPQHSFFRHFSICGKYLRISPEKKIRRAYGDEIFELIQKTFSGPNFPPQEKIDLVAAIMVNRKKETRKKKITRNKKNVVQLGNPKQ